MCVPGDTFRIREHTHQRLGSCRSCKETGATVGASRFHQGGLRGVDVGGHVQVSLLVDGAAAKEQCSWVYILRSDHWKNT